VKLHAPKKTKEPKEPKKQKNKETAVIFSAQPNHLSTLVPQKTKKSRNSSNSLPSNPTTSAP
jgi:hypothetical protein